MKLNFIIEPHNEMMTNRLSKDLKNYNEDEKKRFNDPFSKAIAYIGKKAMNNVPFVETVMKINELTKYDIIINKEINKIHVMMDFNDERIAMIQAAGEGLIFKKDYKKFLIERTRKEITIYGRILNECEGESDKNKEIKEKKVDENAAK